MNLKKRTMIFERVKLKLSICCTSEECMSYRWGILVIFWQTTPMMLAFFMGVDQVVILAPKPLQHLQKKEKIEDQLGRGRTGRTALIQGELAAAEDFQARDMPCPRRKDR